MAQKVLMAGNEAAGEGAVQAGCDAYFGYPITPQNELTAHMARRMPELGRVFIQAESELAAINMVYGASAAGKRAMTSSSSPGISLKQEGISYIAASRLPAVVVNVQRGGPGLGNIGPSQGDYWQATRGGGHGDYRSIVLAPASAQEMFDLTARAFELADRYRMCAIVLADAYLGQMMEPVVIPDEPFPAPPPKPWALTGCEGRPPRLVRSLLLGEGELERHTYALFDTYRQVEREETRWEAMAAEDADVVLVAYGMCARICREAVALGRRQGMRLGLIRPITLWPFPNQALTVAAAGARGVLVVEMSMGQMAQDVRLALEGRRPIALLGRPAFLPEAQEVLECAAALLEARKQ
ncbi:MAG TPA: 3-methyl-2-oxobutanoate dehydrogenase subunit VorB [Planctomycetota bacterium]|nr:3-methyl-2-oxobutanoate dehydrogenase subunit VorB [Planctomycetota bacterium]